MQKTLTVATVVCAACAVSAYARGETYTLDQVLDAIATVESRNDPCAVGDDGRAVGAYQIHERYWTDVRRILKVDWPYADAKDPVKARAAVRAYVQRYAQRYGQRPSVWARVHNGGPRGPLKGNTQKYWIKVRDELRRSSGR